MPTKMESLWLSRVASVQIQLYNPESGQILFQKKYQEPSPPLFHQFH